MEVINVIQNCMDNLNNNDKLTCWLITDDAGTLFAFCQYMIDSVVDISKLENFVVYDMENHNIVKLLDVIKKSGMYKRTFEQRMENIITYDYKQAENILFEVGLIDNPLEHSYLHYERKQKKEKFKEDKMSYSIVFETKIVNLPDGRILHLDRSGCNNDNCGRTEYDFTGKIYSKESFQEYIKKFIDTEND